MTTYRDYLGTLKVNMEVAVMRLERVLADANLEPDLKPFLSQEEIIFYEDAAKQLSSKLGSSV